MSSKFLSSENTSLHFPFNQADDIQRFQERLFDSHPPERRIVLPDKVEIKTVAGNERDLLVTEFPPGEGIRGNMVRGIAFLPPQNLYVMTSRVFAKMDPKGRVWSSLELDMPDQFVDMSVCETTQAVYVLSARRLMRSDDGENWNQLSPPFVESGMTKIGVASNRIAVCNSDGSVCFSEDSGQTWLHTPQIRAKDLCVPYDDPNRFFVLGWDGSVLMLVVRRASFHHRSPVIDVIDTRSYSPAHFIFLDDEFFCYANKRQIVRWNLKDDSQDVIRMPIPGAFSIEWIKRCQRECYLVGLDKGIYLLKLNNPMLSLHPILALHKTNTSAVTVECYHSICYVGGPWPYLLRTHDWGNTWFVVLLDTLFSK